MQEEKVLENVNARSAQLLATLKELQTDPETKDMIVDGKWSSLKLMHRLTHYSAWTWIDDRCGVRQPIKAPNSKREREQVAARQHWRQSTEEVLGEGTDASHDICI